jgi:hypothetical protein
LWINNSRIRRPVRWGVAEMTLLPASLNKETRLW